MLLPGDPAPFFKAASSVNPNFNFDTVAGRYIVLSFFGSSKHPVSERLLTEIVNSDERFDVTNAIFFVSAPIPKISNASRSKRPASCTFGTLILR